MNQAMRDKKVYWIGGTVTGFGGIALVRLIAPELAGGLASIALMAGFTLVIAGITIIAFGTRRRASEALVPVAKDPEDSERP